MLQVDPAQRDRLISIIRNLTDRITEARTKAGSAKPKASRPAFKPPAASSLASPRTPRRQEVSLIWVCRPSAQRETHDTPENEELPRSKVKDEFPGYALEYMLDRRRVASCEAGRQADRTRSGVLRFDLQLDTAQTPRPESPLRDQAQSPARNMLIAGPGRHPIAGTSGQPISLDTDQPAGT